MSGERPEREGWSYPVVALAAIVAYANSFSGVFQFDDHNVIVNNPVVHSWPAFLDDLGHGIRPLLKFSYLLNWLAGPGEWGFHAVNLAVHAASAMLVFRLSLLFMEQAGGPPTISRRAISLTAALIFSVHPVHTESITYISGRSSSLMSFVYLSALFSHAALHGRRRPRLGLIVTAVLFALAVSVKESAVTLPLALLAWDRLTGAGWLESFRREWSSWLILLGLAFLFLSVPKYASLMLTSASMHSSGFRPADQAYGMFYLIGKWFWPVSLNIDPDLAGRGAAIPDTVWSAAIAAWLGAGWLFRRSRPWLSLAVFWVPIHLLVLYVFFPRLDIVNERQVYVASFPLCLAMSAELWRQSWRRVSAALAAVLLVFLTGLTWSRNMAYRSEIALWEDTAAKSPGKARVHNNLGVAYLLAGRKDDARNQFAAALAIDPDLTEASENLRRSGGG